MIFFKQAQITQLTPPDDSDEEIVQRVDGIKIIKLGKVKLLFKGLGNFGLGLSLFLTDYINQNNHIVIPLFRVIEEEVAFYANFDLLAGVNIPFFS